MELRVAPHGTPPRGSMPRTLICLEDLRGRVLVRYASQMLCPGSFF